MVATIKEFRNILLGHQITVYSDNKNITYNFLNTERRMCWRLIIEEFGPEPKYIKGENNVVADSLSCHEMSDNEVILNTNELYGYDHEDLRDNSYSICYHNISKSLKTDVKLNQNLVSHKDFILDTFCGGNQNHRLVCQNSKKNLPVALQKKTLDWYNEMLFHPGERLEQSIPSINILTGKAFAQQSIAGVRNSQHAKEKKQLTRIMANCHLNRMKQIPGTHCV